MCSCGLFQTTGAAAAVYVSLMSHMLHWLVNKRRTVPMLFANVTPLHYRKNWKEIVLGRFLQERWDRGDRWPDIKWVTGYEPTPQELAHNDLVAWNEELGICEWTIEVQPTKWFEDHSNQAEIKNRRTRGGERKRLLRGYLATVVKSIMAHVAQASDIWTKNTYELRKKIVELPPFYVGDNGYLTRLSDRDKACGKVRRPARSVVLPHVLTPDSIATCYHDSEEPEGEELPEVSSLPSADGPVRTPGPDVAQPEDELP
jgi:hypothetical protein